MIFDNRIDLTGNYKLQNDAVARKIGGSGR
jgi:hypothetical protein